ncbi:MAG: DUF3800 domain-containing protein [Bacteroidota bacterium]|nr:DUF3800 domain-containing protein [Bacteroidota bacterium]
MMNLISFDESGNTGQNLLNKEQKAFVLASVRFDQKEVDELKAIFIGSKEIHFRNLKRSKIGREQILEFINHKSITEENILCFVSDKEYVVVAQIIDQLVETVLHKNNVDIYHFGLNLTYTNSFYYFGNLLWNKKLYYSVLHSFIEMIRLKMSNLFLTFTMLLTNCMTI